MSRVALVAGWVALAALTTSGSLYARPQASPAPVSSSPSPQRALLDQYCATCHNDRARTAGLSVEELDVTKVSEDAETWEKILRKVRSGAMPPAGARRPDSTGYQTFATWLEQALDRSALEHPNPGRPALHRLNRAEYRNAIRDLVGMDIDVASLLPSDNSSYGFDNVADVLGVSPVLLERYVAAARKISQVAVGDSTISPLTETYRVAGDLTQNDRLDGLPFGTRGGTVIRHQFPLDGEYVIRIRLQRNLFDRILGLDDAHQIELSVDEQRVQVFTVGGRKPPRGKPDDDNATPAVDAASFANYQVTADEGFEVRIPVKAGPRVVSVTFLKRTSADFEALRRPFVKSNVDPLDEKTPPHIGSVLISGPYAGNTPQDTPSRRRIFVCHPSNRNAEPACARDILSALARRAYRRPVTAADVHTLESFYREGRKQGNFDTGIEMALRRILVSPDFLFRVERDPANLPAGAVYRISDIELASRLSFFLWSSIPDDELLDVAERGQLSQPSVLERQVQRMLGDERASALVTNFVGQWLQLRNLTSVKPDSVLFYDFDDNLRQAFRRETELFVQSIIQEDRSVLDLLTANYSFMNERLARHYGIPNVYGSQFRRITLSDSNRYGLLGHGSILTVTSYATRTSPVLRGKWILENILGAPPPPPPPNVPELKERSSDGKVLSMREQMVQHRQNPICASCHSKMDPLGLPLENFDAVGRWRPNTESNTPIDVSGALPDGTPFEGQEGLVKVLLKQPDEFVRTLIEKLFIYGLGRGLEYYDAPATRGILRETTLQNYRFSSLILGVVTSKPFQQRRSQS